MSAHNREIFSISLANWAFSSAIVFSYPSLDVSKLAVKDFQGERRPTSEVPSLLAFSLCQSQADESFRYSEPIEIPTRRLFSDIPLERSHGVSTVRGDSETYECPVPSLRNFVSSDSVDAFFDVSVSTTRLNISSSNFVIRPSSEACFCTSSTWLSTRYREIVRSQLGRLRSVLSTRSFPFYFPLSSSIILQVF